MRQTDTTFLFTDIEGSTGLWEQHPEAMRGALSRHDALIRQAVALRGGSIVKSTGDGLLAVFASAADALATALNAQIALRREAWPEPVALRVRMGLYSGTETEARDADYFGPSVNRAARLTAAGHGGQILVSDATRTLCEDALPPSVSLRNLGEHRLKDVLRAETVYQLVHPDLPYDFPPLNSLSTVPNNLPQPLTTFIGRERSMAEVANRLSRTRLLTLTGPGGTGKTRLALQVSGNSLGEFPDGVYLVELAAQGEPAYVAQMIANVLGVSETAGQAVIQTVAEHLQNKRLLIVLDNCEHLVHACAQCAATLLRTCPHLRILATSREPLGIAGEQTYPVPPLSLPLLARAPMATAQSLSQYEAVRLFVDRAQAVKSNFAVTNAAAPALAHLCCRLDGIPLALELAAARVRALPVEEINRRLDSRFQLLTGGDRSALPRQQTLRALVDWSYDLLNDSEKTLFARLSVFSGGLTLTAAEAVCGFAPLDEFGILDILSGLIDKSLVVAEETDAGTENVTENATGEPRYRLLETLRQYAAEKLEAAGETAAVRQRHQDFFLALAEEAEPQLQGSDQAAWLTRLESEHENLRAALAWRGSPAANLRLAGALWRFWWVRGYFTEGREHLRSALADQAPSREWARERAKACNGAGNLAHFQADHSEARTLFRSALALYRELSDQIGIANALNNLGANAVATNDYDAARRFYEESLALRRESGDGNGVATSLVNLSIVAKAQGDLSTAQTLQTESLALFRASGHRGGVAVSLLNLGNIARETHDYASARSLHEQSLTMYRELGDKSGIAASLGNLGNVALDQRDYPAARAFLAESLPLLQSLGDKTNVAFLLELLARVLREEAAVYKALVLWGAADALRETAGAPLPPREQARNEEQITRARQALGEAKSADAWAEGRALNEEQAVRYALVSASPESDSC